MYKSYALENIQKHRSKQMSEKIKEIAYAIAEALTAGSIFLLGYLYFAIGL